MCSAEFQAVQLSGVATDRTHDVQSRGCVGLLALQARCEHAVVTSSAKALAGQSRRLPLGHALQAVTCGHLTAAVECRVLFSLHHTVMLGACPTTCYLLMLKLVQYLNKADGFWKKFKRLVFLYKALINQVVDIWFYRSPPVLPCFEGKPSEAKLHPNLSLSQDRPFYFHQLHSLSFCSCPFLTISSRLCVIQSHRSPSPQKQAFLDCACRHPRVSQTAICCSSKLDRQR